MLTADLVRATVRKELVIPRWLDPDKVEVQAIAERLLAVFADAAGMRLGALNELLGDVEAEHPEPLLVKGLAKLLRDRCEMEMVASIAPEELRRAVFEAALPHHPVRPGGGGGYGEREAVLAEVAARFGLDVATLEASLFADLASEQRVVACVLPTVAELVDGYNLALAQACLLRAREARLSFKSMDNKRLRALLRAVKFHRLLVRAEHSGDTLTLHVDGPLSLHHQTGRYGVQLAMLLPAVARADDWALEADVVWHRGAKKGVPATFRLNHESPIGKAGRKGSFHDRGVWVSAEEEHLLANMSDLKGPWRLEPGVEVFDLGGRDVLAPDFKLVHEDGRFCWVEIIWTWRQKSLGRRLELLKEHAPANVIVAWARRGGVEGALDELDHAASLGFKGVISPKQLVALAEKVATLPAVATESGPEKVAGPKKTRRARAPRTGD